MTRFLCVLAMLAAVAGCASEVTRLPAEAPASAPEQGQRRVTARPVELLLESRYRRSIAAGTEFIAVGRIAQGLVWRPAETVLTVEGAHMHEAFAVVRDGQLVGFYLPVERAYSPLPVATPFPLVERTPR